MNLMGMKARDPLARYQEKVDVQGPDDCWEWNAARFEKGYGAFRLGDRQTKAHRTGYELLVGPIPEGYYVCHTCDNPPCQNPRHWFLGTTGDNARDREAKGRGAGARNLRVVHMRGETNGAAKLTEDDVRQIRSEQKRGVLQKELAERFGVSRAAICLIINRKHWPHIA